MKHFTIITSIILLVTAIFDLDIGYWYYQLLRWVVFVCACLGGYFNFENKKLLIIFSVIAIIFNPMHQYIFQKNYGKYWMAQQV